MDQADDRVLRGFRVRIVAKRLVRTLDAVKSLAGRDHDKSLAEHRVNERAAQLAEALTRLVEQ